MLFDQFLRVFLSNPVGYLYHHLTAYLNDPEHRSFNVSHPALCRSFLNLLTGMLVDLLAFGELYPSAFHGGDVRQTTRFFE